MKFCTLLYLFLLLMLVQPAESPCAPDQPIKVGIYANYPQVFVDDDQKAQGIYIDLLEFIGAAEGLQYTYIPGTWSQCIERLNTENIDLLVSIAYTDKRAERYDFTHETVLSNWGQIYTRTSAIQSLLDLSHKRIAVVTDDISYTSLKTLLKKFDIPCDYIEVTEYREVLEHVSQDLADAGAVSRIFGLMNESKFSIHTSPIIYNPIELRFASLKGKQTAIMETIDSHLSVLKSEPDSIYYQSLNKWLGDLGQWVFPKWLKYLIYIVFSLLFLLGVGSVILEQQVRRKTAELKKEIQIRKEQESKLRAYHDNLETLVATRTMELLESNSKLQKSEERYRTILDRIEEGYIETDRDGKITFFNMPACRISDNSAMDMTGMDLRQFPQGNHFSEIDECLKELENATVLPEMAIERKSGDQTYMVMAISFINASDDQSTGYRVAIRDITDEYTAQRTRAELEGKLQQTQRLKAIGTLAGGIAHDFNNLLMGIQGNVSLMLLTADPHQDHHRNLKNIEMCIESGANLAKQLLGFARGGKYEVRPVKLNDIIRKTATMFSRTRKEITLIEHYEKNLWLVDADQGQIEQVLMNIYINSWHAMPQGGEIYLHTINCELNAEDVAPFGLRPGRFVKVTVRDTGVGMDTATQQRIFEPFFTTRELGRGTGLGLASAFGIIKNHSGCIYATSSLNKGTTITFFLPESSGEDERIHEKLELIQPGSETILIVDDEEMILNTGKSLLKKLGYEVLTANGGREAIEIYNRHQSSIRLIILDVIMPFLNGIEVFNEIKTISPEIKVLFSSGYGIDDEQIGILINQGKNFIQKPFSLHKLSTTVRSILDQEGTPTVTESR